MFNKKGDLPTAMLIVIALILSVATLYAFAIFNDKFQTNSKETTAMLVEVDFNQQYILQQTKLIAKETLQNCPNCNKEQIKQKFNESTKWREEHFLRPELGNFYGKIQNNEFEIEKQENNITIKIDDLSVQSQKGYNKIKRNFEICMLFNNAGKFLNDCQ